MKSNFLIMTVVAMVISSSCGRNTQIHLKSGDLLFREAVSTKLSQAIDQVTQTDSATHFSHVGLVELLNGEATVLHASPDGGTCRVTIDEFAHPEGDSARVLVYRLKNEWLPAIPKAIEKAKSMLGRPYNFSYILSDTSHYCSEFVYLAFSGDSIFEMNPMTFIDPATGEFATGWVDYYQKLGLDIPEGLPGCNPNGMAASEKLERLGELR